MRKTISTPISNSEMVEGSQINTSELNNIINAGGVDYISVSIKSKEYSMADVLSTPHGIIIVTQPFSEDQGEPIDEIKKDLVGADSLPLFVEADHDTYEVRDAVKDGNVIVLSVNPHVVSFASRRQSIAMFVNNI